MLKRIAIIKLSSLGDIIHTIPAVYLLKNKLPDSEITWFIEKGNEKLIECFEPFVNIETVSFKKIKFTNILSEIFRLRKIYKGKFDYIIDFQGLIKSSFFSYVIGKIRVGFNKKNLRENIASVFYTNYPEIFDENINIIYKNIYLSKYFLKKFFNIIISTENIKYPPLKKYNNDGLNNFITKNDLKEKEFVILNIGGGWQTKTLKLKQYELLIDAIKHKFKLIILWGNDKEKIIADKLSKKTGLIKTDFLKFNELFELIRSSKFIITSDTLALHIADTVNTKSIGIFGPTNPYRNGSLNPLSKVVYKKLYCSPCHKKRCDDLKCIDHITTEDIVNIIEQIA